jgi:hypothetical protein
MTFDLTLYFGKDQEPGVRGVLDQMQVDNYSVRYRVSKANKPEMVKFDISFSDLYEIYHFGHRQARMNVTDAVRAHMKQVDEENDQS